MNHLETVESSLTTSIDPLIKKQKEDVAKMRTSLLCCNDNPYLATKTLQNITILRIYHQISRIIRYIEMMDKIEAKLYESMDYTLETMNTTNSTAWLVLMNMQGQLQKNMLDSQKLLQPYLDMIDTASDYLSVVEEPEYSSESVLSQTSRDKLRMAAQSVLATLDSIEVDGVEDER